MISLPRLEGRRIGGIPHDADGFVAVDEHGGWSGWSGVYAAGDVTAFPVKQGGIATQQADAVAEAIAAAAGAAIEPRPSTRSCAACSGPGGSPATSTAATGGRTAKRSSLSERHLEPLHNGKLIARYLSPLVDSLLAGDERPLGRYGSAEVPQRVLNPGMMGR